MSAQPYQTLFLVAGEPSGDLQGALLARELKKLNPHIQLTGMGGPLMRDEGVKIITDLTSLAIIGLVEVIKHLGMFIKTLRKTLREIDQLRPQAVILIDYPGFNLKLAAEVKKRNIPVIYYISPQIWAWKKERVKKIARRVDKMICFFDFEVPIYEKEGIKACWVGHPFLDVVRPQWSLEEAQKQLGLKSGLRTIGILPGSRTQEIQRHLPVLLESARLLQNKLGPCQFPISRVSGLDQSLFTQYLSRQPDLQNASLIEGHFYDLIHSCDLVLTSSGSATLITAILEKPMIVIYRVGRLTAYIARRVIKIPYIALANVVAGEKVVPELLQEDANPHHIASTAEKLLTHPEDLSKMQKALQKTRHRLGSSGAAQRAAQEILNTL